MPTQHISSDHMSPAGQGEVDADEPGHQFLRLGHHLDRPVRAVGEVLQVVVAAGGGSARDRRPSPPSRSRAAAGPGRASGRRGRRRRTRRGRGTGPAARSPGSSAAGGRRRGTGRTCWPRSSWQPGLDAVRLLARGQERVDDDVRRERGSRRSESKATTSAPVSLQLARGSRRSCPSPATTTAAAFSRRTSRERRVQVAGRPERLLGRLPSRCSRG